MNVDTTRLVEQAREYCSGAMRKQGEALVAGLADAVERLEAEHEASEREVERATDDHLAMVMERDAARARVAALEAFLDDCLFGFEDPQGNLTDANLDVLRDRALALLDGRVPSTGQETT